MREMTALAKRLKVFFGGVGRVMVKMRCSQDDLFQSDRGIVHDVRPRDLVPPVVTPIVVSGVVPTPVTELSDPESMRSTTPLAAAACTLEPDRPAEASAIRLDTEDATPCGSACQAPVGSIWKELLRLTYWRQADQYIE